MQFVYVIQHSRTQKLYIGCTNNLKRRLVEHNTKSRGWTKRSDGRWRLVYAEFYRDQSDAFEREKRIKHHGRAVQEIKRRISASLLS